MGHLSKYALCESWRALGVGKIWFRVRGTLGELRSTTGNAVVIDLARWIISGRYQGLSHAKGRRTLVLQYYTQGFLEQAVPSDPTLAPLKQFLFPEHDL